MPYTDSTLMPWGMHKGKPLVNVPATYLLYLYNKGLDHQDLKNYIIANMEILETEAKKESRFRR